MACLKFADHPYQDESRDHSRPRLAAWCAKFLRPIGGFLVLGPVLLPPSHSAAPADLHHLGTPISKSPVRPSPTASRRAAAMAHCARGVQNEQADDLQSAFRHFREAFHNDPSHPGLAQKAAELALVFGEPGESERLLTTAIRLNPDDPRPVLKLVDFIDAYQLSDEARARADTLLQSASKRFPARADLTAALVVRHLRSGDHPSAVRVLRQAKAQTQSDPTFWLALARLSQQVWPLGESEAMIANQKIVNEFYEQAWEHARKGDNETIQLEIVQFFVLTNQLRLAQTYAEKIATRSANPASRKLLVRLYDALDQPDQALALQRELVNELPGDISQHRLLASMLEQRRDYQGAAAQLEMALKLGAGNAEEYEKVASLWLALSQSDRAIALLGRAIRLFPELPGFHAQMAMAHAANDQLESAVASFATAEKLSKASGGQPFNHRFHFRYGVALERSGRPQEAAEQFEQSISVTPANATEELANTMNYLGYMWVELGQNLDRATEWITKANELQPDNPAYIDSLGWLLYKSGKHEEALQELQRAEQLLDDLQPEDAEILEHIAIVQEALKQNDDALATLRRAAALNPPNEDLKRRIRTHLERLQSDPKP